MFRRNAFIDCTVAIVLHYLTVRRNLVHYLPAGYVDGSSHKYHHFMYYLKGNGPHPSYITLENVVANVLTLSFNVQLKWSHCYLLGFMDAPTSKVILRSLKMVSIVST